MDSAAHLVSLKVMRVSRPEVPGAWQPFFSSSPHLSAHASAYILSLQGNTPLPGHPKTLRDLTHASDILTLPSSFGSIQLGQTFSSCLSINNEAPFSVDSIRIHVEMQTITAKTLLYQTLESVGQTLPTGDTLECIVNHEIKELGQHVLACAVSYRLPPNLRPIPGANEDPNDPTLQTFRKFYKFIVTNPLAVKTKVHPVRSPTALLAPTEREKILLEVHIQNVTQETMHFERLSFEPMDEWLVQDPNISGSTTSLMNPQDLRQYIFILSPTTSSPLRPLAVHPPGSIYPLGRLNIIWRSAYGEPGRLLTSTLTRRIPLINPGPGPTPSSVTQQPASALPPHLKREKTVPSRPQSPNPQSRPSTPPLPNMRSPAGAIPSTNLGAVTTDTILNHMEAHLTLRDVVTGSVQVGKPFVLGFTLHVTSALKLSESTQAPLLFAIQHVLPLPPLSGTTITDTTLPAVAQGSTINTSVGQGQGSSSGYNTPRTILSPTSHSVSQSTQSTTTTVPHTAVVPTDVTSPRASLSVLSSGFSTPTAASSHGGRTTQGTFNYTLARQKLLVASPREMNTDYYYVARHQEAGAGGGADGEREGEESDNIIYPPPYPLGSTVPTASAGAEVGLAILPTGASSFAIPPLILLPRDIPPHPSSSSSTTATILTTTSTAMHTSHSSTSTIDSTDSSESRGFEEEGGRRQKLYASYDFELTYVPLRTGFCSVRGVRVLFLGEGDVNAGAEERADSDRGRDGGLEIQTEGRVVAAGTGETRKAQIVKEYDVVAEIMVSS